jgi:hypothetical protein
VFICTLAFFGFFLERTLPFRLTVFQKVVKLRERALNFELLSSHFFIALADCVHFYLMHLR